MKSGRPKNSWEIVRKRVFKRDSYRCVRCDANGDRMKLQVYDLSAHHILPRIDGGDDNIENLITLCIPCHDLVEVNGLKSRVDIIASYEGDAIENSSEKINDRVETFHRPAWHAWVYGSARNPLLDIR